MTGLAGIAQLLTFSPHIFFHYKLMLPREELNVKTCRNDAGQRGLGGPEADIQSVQGAVTGQ